MQKLSLVIRELEAILPMVGSSSELGGAVLKAISGLVKYAPAGGASPASQQNQISDMARRNQQSGAAIQALRQQGAKPPGGAPPGGAPPGGAPEIKPPMAA